jgi:hypothetical protein
MLRYASLAALGAATLACVPSLALAAPPPEDPIATLDRARPAYTRIGPWLGNLHEEHLATGGRPPAGDR